MKIPRKLKKKIPIGMYCYTGLKFDINTGIYHIKPCFFYKNSFCKLLKCEIDDQCKECGLRYGFKN
jgi:hypothetical protein